MNTYNLNKARHMTSSRCVLTHTYFHNEDSKLCYKIKCTQT